MNKGVIIGVDRKNSVCAVSLNGGPTVTAPYINGAPPPRSLVWCEDIGNGSWLIHGTVGERRLLFREDFGFMFGANTDNTMLSGDGSNWLLRTNGVGVGVGGPHLTAGNSQIHGLVTLSGTGIGVYCELQKDPTLANLHTPNVGALWYHARFAVNTITTNIQQLGFGTPAFFIGGGAAAHGVSLRIDSGQSGNFSLQTALSGVYTTLNCGVTPVANTWYDLDLVWRLGWAAMWIDGAYLGKNTTNLPDVGFNVPATIITYGNSAGLSSGYYDCVDMEVFNLASQP